MGAMQHLGRGGARDRFGYRGASRLASGPYLLTAGASTRLAAAKGPEPVVRSKGAGVITKHNYRLARIVGASVIALVGFGAVVASAASAATTSASTPPASTAAGSQSLKSEFGSIGAAKATGKTLSLAKGNQGIFAIGPDGHSLYVYDKDHGTKSACVASCASTWTALTASGAITTGVLIKKSEVAKVDGQKPDQVSYYGHLLYYFNGDTAPGQTNGVRAAGWHLLGPFGNVMLPR
jgi:predicted lipoprotein with Yx(FWY)xxD motif